MKKSLTLDQLETILAQAFAIADQPIPELEFEPGELEIDWDNCPEPPIRAHSPLPATGSRAVKISIRIEPRTLAAIKQRAAQSCTRYQSLINRQLRSAVKDWGYL